jgi:hypothetical protein
VFETSVQSTFVSQVAAIAFADAAAAADDLTGLDITAGRVRLEIHERSGNSPAGAVRYSGVLRTGSALIPSVKVDVVLSPWSAGRTEIGIGPLSRLGRSDSFRTSRFFTAAWSVLPVLIDRLEIRRPVEPPAGLPVAA